MEALDQQAIDACVRRFERSFRDEPYYSAGRTWGDYAPAYRYALHGYGTRGAGAFGEVESELAHEWEIVREGSRLTWAEARPAMAAAWRAAWLRKRA